jgi:hypothetical protein
VNDERQLQKEKHSSQTISTDDGMQIDLNAEHRENAFAEI